MRHNGRDCEEVGAGRGLEERQGGWQEGVVGHHEAVGVGEGDRVRGKEIRASVTRIGGPWGSWEGTKE